MMKYQNKQILLFSNYSNIFGFALFVPLYATYIVSLGEEPSTASYLWSLHTLLVGVLVLIAGRVEDRHPKDYKHAIILGNVLQVVGTLLFVASQSSFAIFAAGLLVYSAGTAVLAPSWFTLFAKQSKQHAASSWSLSQGGGALSGAAGAALGGVLFGLGSYELVFAMMSLFHLLGLLSALAIHSK